MKLTVDPGADALYLTLGEAQIADSEQVAPGVVVDYDANENIVGLELLHLSKRSDKVNLNACYLRRYRMRLLTERPALPNPVISTATAETPIARAAKSPASPSTYPRTTNRVNRSRPDFASALPRIRHQPV